MKSVIIKQKTKDGLQKIFHIKQEKDGTYSGDILTDLIGLVEIIVIANDGEKIKITSTKK